MTENDKRYVETIALLKKELKAREKDLHLAATYGKQLLEEKDEALSQIEVLQQEKYSLQLNLETQTQSAQSQASELESYVKQVNCLEKDIPALEKEISVLRQRNDNFLKEKHDLESNLEGLQLENSGLKNKIALLQQQIETFKNVSILNDTRCEEDLPDINEYISKIKTLEDTLKEMHYELESTKLSEKRLMKTVKELEEAVSDRDKELSSEVQRIADLQETVAELQCEIETLKLGQLDVNRRGNSMFAELDDRRKSVEKLYKELSKKYSNMLTNYEENKTELENCKAKLSILTSMTSKKHQEEQIKKLRQMLSEALRKKEELTGKLCRAEKALQSIPQALVKGDQYNYLRILNQQAQEKITKIENELMSERMQALYFEKKLASCIQELYACQETLQEVKSENLKLKEELKEITSKPDVCVTSKPKVKIEIATGYESNPECMKLAEMAMKENSDPREKNDIVPGELKMSENGFAEVKSSRLSNKARLRNLQEPLKSEAVRSNDVLAEPALKEINTHDEKVDCGQSEAFVSPENRKVNCAQQ